jgi:peptide/nickel transport system substrate-binding protein
MRKQMFILGLVVVFVISIVGNIAAEQVLRIATASSGETAFTFYPLQCGSDGQNWYPFNWVPPLYFDVNMKLQPGIFNSWEHNADSTVWTFKIDPRAKFSDNTPVTAADVKGTWEAMANPEVRCGRSRTYLSNVVGFQEAREAANFSPMPGLKVIDNTTLEVTLLKPDPAFHWRIATCHLNPVKISQAREKGIQEFWRPENNPAVTGPFKLETYDPNLNTATMVPNPNWWMGEGPYLDKITFEFVPDPQTTGVMVLNGQIDVSLAPIPSALKSKVPDFFRPIKSFGYNVFWLRPFVPPTDDINVRKALALSVDWDVVFKATFPVEGTGIRSTQPIDPDIPAQDPNQKGYPYDPETARAALAASKYGSADKLPKIRVTPRGTDEYNNRALEAVMEFWRKNLGITNIEYQERPTGFGDNWTELVNLNRDDVVIRFPDAAEYMWIAAHSTGPVAGPDMLGGYKNSKLDALLEEAVVLDPDDPKRSEPALKAQQLYIDDYLMLHFGKFVMTINAREYVKNYYKGPDVGVIEPWKIKIEK